MSAAIPLRAPAEPAAVRSVQQTTLLDLVRAVGEVTENEDEIVATVIHMLRSGSVQLTGNFRGAPVSIFRR